MNGLTPYEARAQRAHELEARRSAEAACALDFLVYGDGEPSTFMGHRVEGVTHAERCVFGHRHACARTYDPMPYDEADPVPHEDGPTQRRALELYAGTGIGALYGMPGCEDVVLELEGWELKPRTVYE